MIELRDVNVGGSGEAILTDINLSISEGEKVLLKGESGSGKTTLIKTILFYTRFRGEILYHHEPVNESNIGKLRGDVGYIGQTLPAINMKVKTFLELPYTFQANRGNRAGASPNKAQMDQLGLNGKIMEKSFAQLSGGEKQRLMTLQILALERPIYFFDEITSGLDKKNIGKLVAMITDHPRRTVVAISHNQEWENFCSRILHLDQGKIVKENR